MKKTLTSFDVAAIVLELKKQLKGAWIQNIYQIKGKIVILKLRQPNQPTLNLLIESGKRLHLTSYLLEKPQRPPAFCMALRKHLRNGKITETSQHEFERIVTLKTETKEGEFKLVLELFADGNIILVDSQGVIRQALTYKKMRDRNIFRGESFQQPPSSGKNPLHLEPLDLSELVKFKDLELVRALTKFLSLGGMYAEEILTRAQVDKNKKCELLKNSDFDRISKALNKILSQLERKLEPCIVTDEKGRWIDVVPINLRTYRGFSCKKFESFNEALDEYYTKTFAEREVRVVSEKVDQEIAKQRRILHEQQTSLEEERQEAERLKRVGDNIYAHFHQLQTFMQRIIDEKKVGKTWQEIISKIESEKKGKETPSAYFESLDTKKLILNLSIEGTAFSLRLRSSVQESAATYYSRAKKAKKKAKGVRRAIEETLSRIEELSQRKEIAVEETSKPIMKRKKKAWYEKFRWFHTSENLLVVGGKDVVTNDILIKKHTESHDLVLHADIAGAPFVLIKTEGKTPSQQSINEAAQLAASHSRAWKANFSAIDVYWIHPSQVSKSPPTGEYLQRGAFMIHGKKNYIRRTPLQLAIGVDTKKAPLTVIGGPKEAIKSRTDIYAEIVPGDLSSSKLANKIRQILKLKVPENLQENISKIPIEEIQVFIPFGKGRTMNNKNSKIPRKKLD